MLVYMKRMTPQFKIKFKTEILKSSLCDYSDAYILVKGPITIVGKGADSAPRVANRNSNQVIFKYCASFTDCISEINNTQTGNAKILI